MLITLVLVVSNAGGTAAVNQRIGFFLITSNDAVTKTKWLMFDS